MYTLYIVYEWMNDYEYMEIKLAFYQKCYSASQHQEKQQYEKYIQNTIIVRL